MHQARITQNLVSSVADSLLLLFRVVAPGRRRAPVPFVLLGNKRVLVGYPILGAGGRPWSMGKFAVRSAWHCTGPSLDEVALLAALPSLGRCVILLASVGSVEPLRESTSLVGVSPSLAPCRPRGATSSFHPRFLSFLVSFSSGTAAAAAAISSTLGLGRTSTPAMAANCALSFPSLLILPSRARRARRSSR